MSTTAPLHLAVSLDAAGMSQAACLDFVRDAEAGLLDLVTIEDTYRLRQQPPAEGLQAPSTPRPGERLDAIMLAAWLGPRTGRIGIVPAAPTTLTEPFLLSSQIATLDFVTPARAGWLVQVLDRSADGGYVGPRAAATGAAAWAEAAEHVEVVRRLWDSWEDDAVIRDRERNRFFDRDRVHYLDFAGEHLAVKGPSITPRSPQGQPIVAAAVTLATPAPAELGSAHAPAAEIELAAAAADVIFLGGVGEAAIADTTTALAAAGRERAEVRLFADIEIGDAPVPELARQLLDWRAELGLDGFRLLPGVRPGDFWATAHALTTQLRALGAFRAAYEAGSLRGLLGFERPANRYGTQALADGARA